MAAFALFENDFAVELKGTASEVLLRSLESTNEIYGLELFAMVSAVRALGEQLRGKRTILFLDNNAAAGASVKASARAPVILAIIECFWSLMAQLSASCWIERAPSKASPADAPSRGEKSSITPRVSGDLSSLQQALQLSQISNKPGSSIGRGRL